MTAKRVLTDEEVEQVKNLAAERYTPAAIARALGLSSGHYLRDIAARDDRLRGVLHGLPEQDHSHRKPRDPEIIDTTPQAKPPGAGGMRRKTVNAQHRGWIRRWASMGHPKNLIASKLKMDVRTLNNILKDDPITKRAYDEGRGMMEADLVQDLRDQTKRGHIGGAIFLLKAQFGYQDRGTPLVEINNDNRTQVLQMPQAQSLDSFKKMIAQFQAQGGLPGSVPDDDQAHERHNPDKTPIGQLVRRERDDE